MRAMDFFAESIGKQGFKPQTLADDTYVTGAIIDRLSIGNPLSMLLQAAVAWTSASGAAGAKNTLSIVIEHGAAANLSDAADYKTDTYEYTWAADGANSGMHALAADLKAAKRYVRGKIKLTESGTITVSAQTGSLVYNFAGLNDVPSSEYAAAGYEETTEPTA